MIYRQARYISLRETHYPVIRKDLFMTTEAIMEFPTFPHVLPF